VTQYHLGYKLRLLMLICEQLCLFSASHSRTSQNRFQMADEDDDRDQDEAQEPPRRLFTLTEAERARKEIEPVLVEAMGCRKKLAGLESDLSAVSSRIAMMGGVIVPYEKLAAVRLQHDQLAETFNSALTQIIETGCVIRTWMSACWISQRSLIIRTCICAGNWARTASASIIARMRGSLGASLWTRVILVRATSFSKLFSTRPRKCHKNWQISSPKGFSCRHILKIA
jgi:hypothetical protein